MQSLNNLVCRVMDKVFPLLQSRHWEVLDDLQNLDMYSVPASSMDLSIPGICEGYLMKRRKYPLKGWHKVSTAQIGNPLFFCSVQCYRSKSSLFNM